MSLEKNDEITIEIDSCSLQGSGVGRHEGMAVFVPYAEKGEKVLAHIIKVKKTYAVAKLMKVISPSEHRIQPLCPVYSSCGGCSFGHLDYARELEIKENHVKECFSRIAGIEPEFEPAIGADIIYGYRNKAQFPVESDGEEVRTGFYAQRSHRVIPCRECLLQPPEFAAITAAFEEYIRKNSIKSYGEETGKGLIRHIYLRKGTKSGEIMVCPVINGDSLPDETGLVKALTDTCPGIKTVVINTNTEKTNVILGKKCRTIYGSGFITDELCGLEFRLSPLSFYQVNRDQAERLYRKAKEYAALTGEETLLDLYCGTGTIGLTMADRVKTLIGAEIVPQAVEDAKINASVNNITNARFICGDAGETAQTLDKEGVKPDVIILDPPRKGCSEGTIKTAAKMNPARIVYISCDPATLARDCAVFASLGYKTEKVTPCDLFPRTGHCESVAKLIRSDMNS